MGQRRAHLNPHLSPRHLFGYELRSWRDRQGFSLAEVAALVYYDAAHLGKAERGERLLPRHVVEACDRELAAEGALVRLWSFASASKGQPADEAKTAAHEAEPVLTMVAAGTDTEGLDAGSDDPIVLPAVTADGRIIQVRISRREALRTIGGLTVGAAISFTPQPELRERYAHIRSGAGTVDKGIVRPIREALGSYRRAEDMAGGKHLWPIVQNQLEAVTRLLPEASGDVADDLLRLSAEHAHWLSWVAAENKQFGAANSWLDMAHGWASDAGSAELVTWIARVRSTYALSRNDPVKALRQAEFASHTAASASPATASIAAYAEGMAAAALGQADRARTAADKALELGNVVTDQAERPAWLYWLDPVRVQLHRADIAYAVGDWADAAAIYAGNIESLREFPRDHAFYETRLQEARSRC